MPRPSTVTAEIEFTAGVWTDVSADVDWSVGWSFQVGRTSPQGVPQTSTLSLTLVNAKGKFTPGLQVLSDGTAAPYWPNVVPRKRVRVSVNGTVRWLGYIKGWYPQLVNGVLGKVVVQAADRMDALGRVQLSRPIQTQIAYFDTEYPGGASQTHYWPCTDAAGSLLLADVGGRHLSLPITTGNTTGATLGVNGPGIGSGTAASFAPSNSTTGQWFLAAITDGWFGGTGGGTMVAWINPSSQSWAPQIAVSATGAGINAEMGVNNGNAFYQDATSSITGPAISNGSWHMLAIRYDGHFFVDGVDVGAASPLLAAGSVTFRIGAGVSGTNAFNGSVAHVHTRFGSLTATDIAYLWGAGSAGLGETVDTRIGRFLRAAGLATTESNLDASTVTLSTYDHTGKDVVTACQDAAASEGGGAVVYVGTDGKVQFRNRNARMPVAPGLTLDAVRDLDRSVWQPSQDDSTQLTGIIVNRNDATGTLTTQTIDKSAGGQVLNTTITTYTATDADALYEAQDVLAQNLAPGFRLPQVSVDLVHAENNLYAAAFTVGIGSRLRVTGIPTGQAPATQVDAIVEGWREEYSKPGGVESYRMTFDTSPADSPPVAVWDDATYGRWQCDGQSLNATITAVATSLAIATPGGGPTFTTDPTMYPLNIIIGAEIITLGSAPGGSTTPQTFTGVTRGVNGTTKSAQTIGANVDLWPTSTWGL